MKKILFGVALVMLISTNVYAEDITTESQLDSCIATTGNTCVLQNDLAVASQKIIEDGKDIIIDLNGYTLSYNGTATVTSGIIAIRHGGKLTIEDSGEDGTINPGSKCWGTIALTVDGTDIDNNKVAELVVNGGTIIGDYYGIVGNGSEGRDNTKITINGGKISGTHTNDNLAIYHPQAGTITVNDGEISGVTGIEMRAGTLTVNGGTIVGDYTSTTSAPNASGSTTMGAGIAVMQHNTGKVTKVIVNGGTVKGYTAVVQKNIQSLSADKVELVSIELNEGTFETMNGGTTVVESENLTEFIRGGTYSNSIASSYVPTDFNVEESDSKYVVTANQTVEATIEEGEVTFETEDTIDTTYVLVVVAKDDDTTEDVEEQVKEFLENDTTKTDAKLIALYEIDIKDSQDQVVPMSDGTYTISIPVAENMQGFTTYKVIYVNSEGEIEETLDATLVDGKIVFTTSHLSTYGIVGYNEVNPKTGDNTNLSIIISIISLLTLVVSALFLNKKCKAN